MHCHFSTKTALAMMLASAAVYTANVHAADPAKPDPAVVQQLSDAQTKAAQLQGTLAQNAPRATAGGMKPGGMGDDKMMGMMGKMMPMMEKMMPMMEKMMGGMSGMKSGGAMSAPAPMSGGGMGMDDKMEMAGMMGMGSMAGGAPAAMPGSALPGFPGASHLYHIGATGFFLDHPEHITLTTEQQIALNKIKDQALLAKSAADRAIEQAEQDLGKLTAADQPDIGKTETKVREIAKMNGDARLAFIRAVGEAAKLLTADQRKILTGFASPAPAMPAAAMPMPSMAASPSPSPMPMSDM